MAPKCIYKFILYFSFIYLTFTFSSCNYSDNQSNLYIRNADNTIEQSPETAILILDSITNPNLLTRDQFYKYSLLQIEARDRLYKDITQDSIIFEICDYYIRKKEYLGASLSCYYAGRVLHESNKNNKAIHFYNQAEKYANDVEENFNLKGLIQTNIGYLLYNQFEFEEALNSFKKASSYFSQDPKLITKSLSTKIDIGNCFLMLQKNDSANYYYNKSIELADKAKQPSIKVNALMNLGSVYVELENYKEALILYKEALKLSEDNIETQATLYLNISTAYWELNTKDSSMYYLNKALDISPQINDSYLLASLYDTSYKQNEEAKNYKQAFEDLKKYDSIVENIYLKNEKKEVLNIRKKYQFEQIKNLNNQLQIKNQKTIVLSLTIIMALIIICFVYYHLMQKNKRKASEAENKILYLNNLALGYNKRNKTFRDTLLHHFDILKKSAVMQMYLRKDEIKQGEKLLSMFNDIVYKQHDLDWDMLYSTMNELHNGFLDRLKELVPTLDDNEFKICCLIYSDFTNEEIAIIMKYSSSTVTHKRSSIRKKMGLPEYSNITESLKSLSLNL